MRFQITSYDVAGVPSAQIDIGNNQSCILPTYTTSGNWNEGPHSWGPRYNAVLLLEAAKWLRQHGHEVVGESVGPDSRDENYVSPFIADGITTQGVFNCDVVVIRELDSNEFCMIDMQDYPTFGRQWSASDNCIAVYMTMYEREWVQKNTAAPHKYKPFLYFTMNPYDTELFTDTYYRQLPAETATDLRLFFAGTIGDTGSYSYSRAGEDGIRRPWREVALYLKDLAPDEVVVWDRTEKLPRDAWWKIAAQHRWNLFLAGGPWCNREHELWTLGCATIGFEYPRHPLMEPIVPNVDYAAVIPPSGTDNVGRPNNPERAAKELLRRYREVRDDHAFAIKLAKNAQNRMRTVASPKEVVKRILRECWGIGNSK
jgi:hypothetical protein